MFLYFGQYENAHLETGKDPLFKPPSFFATTILGMQVLKYILEAGGGGLLVLHLP